METTYDGEGRPTKVTNDRGNASNTTYDGLGRVIQVEDAGGNAVQVTSHEVESALPSTFEEFTTTMQYDAASRFVKTVNNAGGAAYKSYDALGHVTVAIDENGNAVQSYFDAGGRALRTEWVLTTSGAGPGGGVAGTSDSTQGGGDGLVWEEAGNPQQLVETGPQYFGYDGLSRMILAVETNGGVTQTSRVHYTYDSLARVLQEHQTIGDVNELLVDHAITAQHDGMGNLVDLMSPAGVEVTRSYDALERLDEVKVDASVARYTYSGPARVRSRTNASANLALQVEYDVLKRPTSWTHVDLNTNAAAVDVRYGYDAVGNRLWERRLHDGDQGKRYAYDSAYRLLQTLEGTITSGGALGGPASTSETAAYDGVGNRVTLDRDGSVQDYVTNELNQYHTINGVTLTYDAGGNLRSSGEGAYAYDAFNRLRSASGRNGSIEYLYDARGRRVRAGAISFAYFESRAIEEYTDGAVSSTLVFGIGVDEVLMQRRTGAGALWNMEDVLGSVVAVADGSGVVERYHYESFGKPTFLDAAGSPTAAVASAVGNRILFTGREYEAETGLYFYRARYYSPGMGRFLNRDPAGYVDGLNLHAYVKNNPVNRTDPTGLFVGFLAEIAGRALVGDNFAAAELDGFAQGAAIVGNAATFGQIPALSNAANAAIKEHGAAGKFSDACAKTGITALMAAATGGASAAAAGEGGIVVGGSVVAGSGTLAVEAAATVTIATSEVAATGAAAGAVVAVAATVVHTGPPEGTGPGASRGRNVQANKAKGEAYKAEVKAQREATQNDVTEELTVEGNGTGVRTRVDVVGRDPATGRVVGTEAKASQAARLTRNQKAAIPDSNQNGGTVVGKGRPGYPPGSQVDEVQIQRP